MRMHTMSSTWKRRCSSLGELVTNGLLPFLEATNLLLPACFIGTIWVVYIINVFTAHSLSDFGINPRKLLGILGILTAPFIHVSFSHIVTNTLPLFFLSAVLQKTRGTMHFLLLTAFFVVFGGLMVWAFARGQTSHVGASGLIFSYMGFFILAGMMKQDLLNVIVAVLVTFLYGTILIGLIPSSNVEVSWEGHLFGFLVGWVVGYGYFLMGGQEEMEQFIEENVGSAEERAPILA